ncbi:rRNA accumulation- protein [Coemansia sp. RSA 455]|nr:rRNA accumulation- protein [Coemansia sp. S17]KAJ2019657.1 rRNA accumulation- protein [Coemansia sp. S680]KAJ2051247.1 rRNA accumulation- protein [Coemansia sp. S2]KAJ2102667.1 rRNA accumulation- protein [Coemansia sp. RSA 922]KAJ2243015.1 rRNA accumulation- protein [Coemansia sp. RSA 455]KAJ2422437.1 rRNA accumulation- protein [Coemansia sp. RSA 2531]
MDTTSQRKIHPNKEAFIEGVDHILAKWTALGLAVEHGWGGRETQEKREDMVDDIVQYFDDTVNAKKKPEPLDLQDLLLEVMELDFHVDLKDESEKEVAAVLCKLFAECKSGNFATVDKLAAERDAREALGQGNAAVKMSQAAARPAGFEADDSDSDSDSGSDSEDSDADMEED